MEFAKVSAPAGLVQEEATPRVKRTIALDLMWCYSFRRFVFSAFEVALATFADLSSVLFDNSARRALAIFAESILYRAAKRARFESFASDCLGL